jgi:hypothetical protein
MRLCRALCLEFAPRSWSQSASHMHWSPRISSFRFWKARILREEGLWIWWRSHATVRLRLRHRFLYPWPCIAGIDRSFASRSSSVSCAPHSGPKFSRGTAYCSAIGTPGCYKQMSVIFFPVWAQSNTEITETGSTSIIRDGSAGQNFA